MKSHRPLEFVPQPTMQMTFLLQACPPRTAPNLPATAPSRRRYLAGQRVAWLPSFATWIQVVAHASLLSAWAQIAPINLPLGPYTHPQASELALATHFNDTNRVVLTSYFYWYDVETGAHLTDNDGTDALTDHPPRLEGFSFKSTAWHQEQLEDMIAAGIDVLLPVYWGEPSQRVPGKPASEQPWSFAGLPPLVKARDSLLAAGRKPPSIGLFYDTSTLEYNQAGKRIDLTTDTGRRWFYETIRDFFSLIPARHWATMEGRPIIFLYSASFAAAHDQTCIDYVLDEFARDFSGRRPYIVREISWNVKADQTYAWGGAISLRNPGVAALGPGYDHSAVPGRTPLIISREGGAFFERQWIRFLRAPSNLVHIETWNEYHEGTDIAASKEYGRQYIELNRKYSDMFKAGIKPPRPRGPFSDFKSVTTTLAATNDARGLNQFEFADGATAVAEAGGQPCRKAAPTEHAGRYVYFQIHDSFKWADRMLVDVDIEYFDQGSGGFRIEYDGPDPHAPFQGAYTASNAHVTFANSRQWKRARFRLTEARFLNSQNGGADFRIALQGETLYVRRVTVTRLGMPDEAGKEVRGAQQDFGEPLGAAWLLDGDSTAFHQRNGLLEAGPARSPAFLLATTPGKGASPIEMLARVRPVSPPGTSDRLGGLILTADSATGTGAAALLRQDGEGTPMLGLILAGDSSGPYAVASWKSNLWYWLRVRFEPNDVPRYPDLWARLWPADGDSPEPEAWTAWRDISDAASLPAGYPGILAGPGRLDIDWILLKCEQLPIIVATPPALKPALLRLEPDPASQLSIMRFHMRGDAGIAYVVESTSDFVAWTQSPVTLGTDGNAEFAEPASQPYRFYRTRLVQ